MFTSFVTVIEKMTVNFEDIEILEPIIHEEGGTWSLYSGVDKKGKKIAVKSIPCLKKSEETIIKEIKIWEKYKYSDKPKSFPVFYCFFREEFSSKTRKNIDYHLIFDNYPTSLKNIIENLKKPKKIVPFPLSKLFHFTKSLIKTLAFLQTLKLCQRDLAPERFLVDEESNNIFVIDFYESQEIKYFDAPILSNSNYLSPELRKIYDEGSQKNMKKIDVFRSEVFSLGLMLLELGGLELPERGDYTYTRNIEKAITQLQENYDKIALNDGLSQKLKTLVEILRLCLKFYSEDRPDFIGIFLNILMKESQNDDEKIRRMILMD